MSKLKLPTYNPVPPEINITEARYDLEKFYRNINNNGSLDISLDQHTHLPLSFFAYDAYIRIYQNINQQEIDKNAIQIAIYLTLNSLEDDSKIICTYDDSEESFDFDLNEPLVKVSRFINPKILGYYLLLKNPEYIRENDNIEGVISQFKDLCDNHRDITSFKLLVDALKATGKPELIKECEEFIEFRYQHNMMNKNSESNKAKLLKLNKPTHHSSSSESSSETSSSSDSSTETSSSSYSGDSSDASSDWC